MLRFRIGVDGGQQSADPVGTADGDDDPIRSCARKLGDVVEIDLAGASHAVSANFPSIEIEDVLGIAENLDPRVLPRFGKIEIARSEEGHRNLAAHLMNSPDPLRGPDGVV